MATVTENNWTIVGSSGKSSISQNDSNVCSWEWRPLLKIAEQLLVVFLNIQLAKANGKCAIENDERSWK